MYKCNHCNITFKNKDDEGILNFRGKMYCKRCEEPIVEIPDMPQAAGAIHGAQATLISNSDNRITTNNYYGGGTPDEQIDTPYGSCRKSEARFCKQCRQWVPLYFFNVEQDLCDNCVDLEGNKAFEEGKLFFDTSLFDEALKEFIKYKQLCKNPKNLPELHYYIARCYYEQEQWQKAISYFIRSKEKIIDSIYYLGLCYFHGKGVPQDYGRAKNYITEAAQSGCLLAQDFIRKEEQKEEEEKRKQEEKKRRIQEELKHLEVLRAMSKEASSAYDNDNYAEAARLWQQALDQGYILSRDYINCLAYSYERINEFKKAIVLYKSVEARGDAYTLYRLGDLYYSGYYDGEDFQPDKELGKDYLKRAAEKGSKQALDRLHEIHEKEHSEMLVYGLNKAFDLASDAIDSLLGDS